ncbi:hypothetical protein LI328DRAFT_168922 [Trichoderma asperelloides]|nr:hypothetical protein LI328DRAFT_168922 [Trichoderma asperelloides]
MSSGAHSNFSITERLRHLIRLPRPVPYHAALCLPHFFVPTALCPWWLLAAVRLQHQRAATLHSRQDDTHQAVEWHSFKLLSLPGGPCERENLRPSHIHPTSRPSTPANSFSNDQPACARVALDAGEAIRRRCQYTLGTRLVQCCYPPMKVG